MPVHFVNLNLFSDTVNSLTVKENTIDNVHEAQINSATSTTYNEKYESNNKLGLIIDKNLNHIEL